MPASPSLSQPRAVSPMLQALGSTLLIQALVTVALLTVPVFAPAAMAELGLPPNAVGLYASISYCGAMISTLLASGWILRFGAMRTSQVSLALCGAGLLATLPAAWPAFAASALIVGMGYGPTTPASSHILARHASPQFRNLIFSIKQTGVPIGGMITGALVPFLTVTFGWRGAAAGVALLCLAGIAVVAPLRRRLDAELKPGEPLWRGGFVAPLKLAMGRELRELTIASFCFAGLQQCLSVFLVTYLVHDLAMPLVEAGLMLSAAHAGGIVGRVGWGALADRIRRSRTLLGALGLMMTACALAASLFAPGWPAAAIGLVAVLFGATAIGWNGVFLAEVVRIMPPDQISRATGGALAITFLGVMIAPPVFGAVTWATGSLGAGYAAMALVTAASAAQLLRRAPRG